MMTDAILGFPKQLTFQPIIENAAQLRPLKRFIVAGMGGSNLAADLIKMWQPGTEVLVHRDYGLPLLPAPVLKNTLVIASSFSSATEETLDAFETAVSRGLATVAIGTEGPLIRLARQKNTSFITLPSWGIQPRAALGLSIRATLKAMGRDAMLTALAELGATFKPALYEPDGQALAERLYKKIPIVYSSRGRRPIAYNWKIKLNETAKVPAFCNVLPELNHNEMTGFDGPGFAKIMGRPFAFVLLTHANDHPRITKRFGVLKGLLQKRGFDVMEMPIAGASEYEATFKSLITADWTAVHLAQHYGVESEQVPMVEEFKKLI